MRFSLLTTCLIGATHEDALARARELYGSRTRDVGFDEWVTGFRSRAVIGSVEEVAENLREYERLGCERVMLQHLLHTDLEPVRLLGRELAPALAT
jgi:alkanesulfonate monooxygenase SsuD/methylene tetrahydromethanopterin reductase-like flavin-dependent oxidoreductase (luciferase family)